MPLENKLDKIKQFEIRANAIVYNREPRHFKQIKEFVVENRDLRYTQIISANV